MLPKRLSFEAVLQQHNPQPFAWYGQRGRKRFELEAKDRCHDEGLFKMASSSSSSTYLIKFHHGDIFVRDPFSYDYEILNKIPNVNMAALDFVSFVKLLVSECGKNGNVLDIYVSHTVFELHDATYSSQQDVGNVEQNDDSDSDLDGDYNIYEFDSESEESDTTSVDHLSDGEEEVYDARTRKPDLAPKKSKKMFDAYFLSMIYNGLLRDEYAEKDSSTEKYLLLRIT
ncbi:hypothetical protein Tco_1085947 [Tanacetum coccineum]